MAADPRVAAGAKYARLGGHAAYEQYVRTIRSDPEPAPAWEELSPPAQALWCHLAGQVIFAALKASKP